MLTSETVINTQNISKQSLSNIRIFNVRRHNYLHRKYKSAPGFRRVETTTRSDPIFSQ